MNEHTYGDFFEGMRLFLIQFAKALTVVHEWYERNAENIAKYLLLFADIGICTRQRINWQKNKLFLQMI